MKRKLERIKMRTLPVLRKYEVVKAGIFGSYARGDEKRSSDIDILIKFKGKKSLFDLVGLELELERILKKKVDLLTYNGLHHLLKDKILKEEIKIL